MAKKWPEKVIQRLFIKGHSFPIGLYSSVTIISLGRSKLVKFLAKSGTPKTEHKNTYLFHLGAT